MVGRKEELVIINKLLESKQPKFLAVNGRRHEGKTYPIREALVSQIDFERIGLKDGALHLQLRNFKVQLDQVYPNNKKQIFYTWISTFGFTMKQHSLGTVEQHFTMDILFDLASRFEKSLMILR
jgi:hypothetical protein